MTSTYNVNEIEQIISDIKKEILRIEKGVMKGQEASDFLHRMIDQSQNIFGTDTDNGRFVDRWITDNNCRWRSPSKPEIYAGESEIKKFNSLAEKLIEILSFESISVPDKNEYSFSATQKYEADRFLITLFKSVKGNILIVDEHLDNQVFDFLDLLEPEISIKIITGNGKPIFKRLYEDLKNSRGNIEARINTTSHNRYVVIDNETIYSTDASINTIGKKDFMIHKVVDKQKEVLEKIKKWWLESVDI